VKTIEWAEDKIRIIDQTRLPWEQVFLELDSYNAVATAIKEMRIRGAPALGIVAAYAMALGAQRIEAKTREEFLAELHRIGEVLAETRPTAVNLFRAVERLEEAVGDSVAEIRSWLIGEARLIEAEEAEANRRMGTVSPFSPTATPGPWLPSATGRRWGW
jgi:methylthioribose-1-phosphate isomerase